MKGAKELSKKIGEMLVAKGHVTKEQLEKALFYREKLEQDISVGEVLVEMGYVSKQNLLDVLNDQRHTSYEKTLHKPKESLVREASEKVLRKHQIIPLNIDVEKGILYLAMANTSDYKAVDEMRRIYEVKKVVKMSATEEEVYQLLDDVFDTSLMEEDFSDEAENQETEEEDDEFLNDDSPIIKFVNDLLAKSVKMGASDIHIEPQLKLNSRVRLRVDGELIEYAEIPRRWHSQLVSRIKIMSELDISKRYEPQDGETRFKVGDSLVNMRVSILPLTEQEKVVIRILGQANQLVPLEEVGLSPKNVEIAKKSIAKKQGMILVTGPTGSGKTTTMYAMLKKVNDVQKNISTIEDPVEINVPGLNQVQVNKRMTFAMTLRSLLRQDPDIIMVGEIRDQETAEISVRASLTGHLVLSTLHTNNALATITRLIDMDIQPYLLADALELVISQRLVRKICSHCKAEDPEGCKRAKAEYPDIMEGTQKLYTGEGCDKCNMTGYAGRVSVQEVLQINDELRSLMIKKDLEGIRNYNKTNLMLEDVLGKMILGETDYEQVLEVMLDF